jgi:hypothetical protein
MPTYAYMNKQHVVLEKHKKTVLGRIWPLARGNEVTYHYAPIKPFCDFMWKRTVDFSFIICYLLCPAVTVHPGGGFCREISYVS